MKNSLSYNERSDHMYLLTDLLKVYFIFVFFFKILILAPTREIAVQIHSVITAIGVKMEGLECHVFIGGTPLSQDKTRLKKCHIAVGSPGKISVLVYNWGF